MDFSTLRRRARNHTLEVEHILGIASARPDGLADELERLIVECGWHDGRQIDAHTREIPFRRWARTAIAYARDGCDGLVQLVARDAEYHRFALSLIEEIHTADALVAALQIDAALLAPDSRAPDVERADYLARTLWSLIGLKHPVPIESAHAAMVRAAFQRILPRCRKAVQQAHLILVLGKVGDAATLDLLSAHPPLDYPWDDILKMVQRELRKTLAQSAKPTAVPSSVTSRKAKSASATKITPVTEPVTTPVSRPTKPRRTAAPAPVKLLVHDKAKWHSDATDFKSYRPRLRPEAGATHIAHYLRWCAENDQLSDELLQTHPRPIADIRKSTRAARDFLLSECDGVFDNTALNPAGQAFARAYYHTEKTNFARKHATYLADYELLARKLGAGSSYRLPADNATYARIKSIIDTRHREYLAEARGK